MISTAPSIHEVEQEFIVPQHFLAEKFVQEYLLLERSQLNLEQKIEAMDIRRRVAEARQDITKMDNISGELVRLNHRLQQVKADLKKYPISIPETISNTSEDRCRGDVNQLTLQDIKTEIVRLENRRNALWIFASHEKMKQDVLSKRLSLITKSIDSLQPIVSPMEAAVKAVTQLAENPTNHLVQTESFFNQPLKRDLRSSHDMRLTLRMS